MLAIRPYLAYLSSDKTQVFHDKIQIKQKELQPWTAKINAKQAEMDVAISERDALAKKAEALKAQCQEADEIYKALQEEYRTKVSSVHTSRKIMLTLCRRRVKLS